MCAAVQEQSPNVVGIRSWAKQLASENRDLGWVIHGYVWPESVKCALKKLEVGQSGLMGLVGLQGVGKSSALQALTFESLKANPYNSQDFSSRVAYFKWQRSPIMFRNLLDGLHELSKEYLLAYKQKIIPHLKDLVHLNPSLLADPGKLDHFKAERVLGKRLGREFVKSLQRHALVELIAFKESVLIDMPDYSRTDSRLLSRDLDEIQELWSSVNRLDVPKKPNFVIALQKEVFDKKSHFLYDKMDMVIVSPLEPEQILNVFLKRFGSPHPFTDDALLDLARMSRGVFRRFLRYVLMTLDVWECEGAVGLIDAALVRKSIPVEVLVEDLEYELSGLFPKQSELKCHGVKLLMELSELGTQSQTQLEERLGLKGYEVSRLVQKLELGKLVARRRRGREMVISLRDDELGRPQLSAKDVDERAAHVSWASL